MSNWPSTTHVVLYHAFIRRLDRSTINVMQDKRKATGLTPEKFYPQFMPELRRVERFDWLWNSEADWPLERLMNDKGEASGGDAFWYETIVKPIGKPSK